MQKPLSRLEKFLYALCSLDSSELPNPLSRLEILLKCLVTGETPPAFEPLSRNEKYLMAILGLYHDELPNPISRGEKLLYKLATGDDSIDDIGEALSRYEELLAYIVENGCLDGPIDVEYVTYILMSGQNTLYNTKEAPVKSAILSGKTLVNLSPNKSVDYTTYAVFSYTQLFKFDTIYTIIYDVIANDNNAHIMVDNIKTEFYDTEMGSYYVDSSVGHHQMTFTYLGKYDGFNWWVNQYDSRVIIDNIIILEGDYTNVDIPYFEGMQSVKMPVLKTTGKNLFHGEIERGSYSAFSIDKVDSDTTRCRSSIILLIPDGFNGTISISDGFQFYLRFFKGAAVVRESGFTRRYSLDNTSNTFSEVTIVIGKVNNTQITDDELTTIKIQIEEGSAVTEYEPHKSNILTANEEVELRGVGDVQDELDLLTGELTRRIDESGNILSQEITESIDISVIDQDGNEAELSSFEDITHVTVTSEGILPDVELEVATKNEEVLNTMSLKMDDIYATQTTLEETSNAQSENVDATMMATTEIYEGLL